LRISFVRGEIMKKIFGAMVTGCLLALVIAVPAHAQLPGTQMRVSIPFDFTVRGKTLPSGEYEVSRIGDEPISLLIRNVKDKRDHVVFETEPVYAGRIPNRGLVVFHRYGDSYFLSEVVTAGEDTARELTTSRAERQLQREMASNKAEPETVALAVN
jgi:hypothetical protein